MKQMNLLCSSQASTAICLSMDDKSSIVHHALLDKPPKPSQFIPTYHHQLLHSNTNTNTSTSSRGRSSTKPAYYLQHKRSTKSFSTSSNSSSTAPPPPAKSTNKHKKTTNNMTHKPHLPVLPKILFADINNIFGRNRHHHPNIITAPAAAPPPSSKPSSSSSSSSSARRSSSGRGTIKATTTTVEKVPRPKFSVGRFSTSCVDNTDQYLMSMQSKKCSSPSSSSPAASARTKEMYPANCKSKKLSAADHISSSGLIIKGDRDHVNGSIFSPSSSARYLLGDHDTPILSILPDLEMEQQQQSAATVKHMSSSSSELVIQPQLQLLDHVHDLNTTTTNAQHSRQPNNQNQVVVLKVSIHCKGCEMKVRKHISRMEGVRWFSIDMGSKKVTLVGDISPASALQSVSRIKNAQLWQSNPNNLLIPTS